MSKSRRLLELMMAVNRKRRFKVRELAEGDIRERIDGMKDRVDFLAPKRRVEAPWLGRLLDAAVRGQALRIAYETKDGAVETRRIRPALMHADDGFWYCTAYCHERGDYRVFRCDRIRHAEPEEADLQPLDPEEVKEARSVRAEAGERVRLRAALTAEGVRRWESRHWLAPMVKVAGDGSGTVDTEVPRGDLPYYAELFIALGSEAEAEGPEELRAEIRRRLAERMERYRG